MGFPHGPSTPPPVWEQAMDAVNDSVTSTEMFFLWTALAGVVGLCFFIIERLTRRP